MIHTFEVHKTIYSSKMFKLARDFFDDSDIEKLRQGEKVSCKWYEDYPGLHEITAMHKGEDYYLLNLTVEPQSLILGEYTVSLFDATSQSNQALREAFSKAINEIAGSALPNNIDRWYTARIDYAINLECSNVDLYVQLAKRGKDPYRYQEKVNRPGSSYRECKSTKLNFYDKEDQISKKYNNVPRIQQELLQEAEDVYRIEVQCRQYSKLLQIKKKYNLRDMKVTSFLNADVAYNVVVDYYGKVIGPGDYYSLSEAKKKIDSTGWRRKKKENIYNWLCLIAQARSVSKARKQFILGKKLKNKDSVVKGSYTSFNNYVKACREINLNPVTIPQRWGFKKLSNPFSL